MKIPFQPRFWCGKISLGFSNFSTQIGSKWKKEMVTIHYVDKGLPRLNPDGDLSNFGQKKIGPRPAPRVRRMHPEAKFLNLDPINFPPLSAV